MFGINACSDKLERGFSLSPAQAFVNDVDVQLFNLYTQLRTAVDSVIEKASGRSIDEDNSRTIS